MEGEGVISVMERAELNIIEEIATNEGGEDKRGIAAPHGEKENSNGDRQNEKDSPKELEMFALQDILDFINSIDLGNGYLQIHENEFVVNEVNITETKIEENLVSDEISPLEENGYNHQQSTSLMSNEFLKSFGEEYFHKMTDPYFVNYLMYYSGLGVTVDIIIEDDFQKSLGLTLKCGKTPAELIEKVQRCTTLIDFMYKDTTMFFLMALYDEGDILKSHPLTTTCTKLFVETIYFRLKSELIWVPYLTDLISGTYTISQPELSLNAYFFFNETRSTWQAFSRCFHPKIFYPQLYLEFFTTSHFVMIRYLAYIEEFYNRCVVRAGVLSFALDILTDIERLKYYAGMGAFTDSERSIYIDFVDSYNTEILQLADTIDKNFNLCYLRIRCSYITECVRDLDQFLNLQPMIFEFAEPRAASSSPSRYITIIVREIANIWDECEKRPLLGMSGERIINGVIQKFTLRYKTHINLLYSQINKQYPSYNATYLKTQLRCDVDYFCRKVFIYTRPYTRNFFQTLLQRVA